MELGSIADAFAPPYGDLIKGLIGTLMFGSLAASVDMGWNPGA